MKYIHLLNNPGGSAMVISLMTLVLMTMVGMALLLETNTETQIAAHDMRTTQALFNSEAGIGEALARMANPDDMANYVGEPEGTATPGWGVYIVDQSGNSAQDPNVDNLSRDGFDNDLDGMVDEKGERYTEIKTKQEGDDRIQYPWVSIQYFLSPTGEVILFGDHDNDPLTPQQQNTTTGAPVLRVLSQGDRGSAKRLIEVDAIKPGINVPIESALYIENSRVKFNGTQFLISGQDWDPLTGTVIAGNEELYGVTTTDDPEEVESALSGQQQNNIEGLGPDPSIGDASWDLSVDAVFNSYVPLATTRLAAGTYSGVNLGDWDNFNVVYVDGKLTLSGSNMGAGLLLVDGKLTVSGSFTWYGLIVVRGDIKNYTGGVNGVNTYGAVMCEGTADISGNADVRYSSMALNRVAELAQYQVVNWREIQ
jgi:hypothetical protein